MMVKGKPALKMHSPWLNITAKLTNTFQKGGGQVVCLLHLLRKNQSVYVEC